jgi:hypothetical protein
MSGDEMFIFIGSFVLTLMSLYTWYNTVLVRWPEDRGRFSRRVLMYLPVAAFIINFFTLKVLAAYDVVDSPPYIALYIFLGYAWLFGGMKLFFLFLDISWMDDTLNLDNKAALLPVTAGYLGLTIIYAAANTGDGPGWWCVVVSAGIGVAAWLILAAFVSRLTNISERITIERDVSAGIHFGLYLLASSLILGKASSGDWTSFQMTIYEFSRGIPVIPLSLLIILLELLYRSRRRNILGKRQLLLYSTASGMIYVVIGIVCMILIP